MHTLQSFNESKCDWAELLASPKKRFPYYEEILTGETLRKRLLKEDIQRLQGKLHVSWPTLCLQQISPQDFENHHEEALNLHLLLAFFYAMQPGAFSFSMEDLLGATTDAPLSLMCPNENILYGSLPSQMRNRCSFASRLRNMLLIRNENALAFGSLVQVPMTCQKGVLILIYQLEAQKTELLAINFSKQKATQTLEIPTIRETTAIDLMTGLAEQKPLHSPTIHIELPPLSGKVILFQPKYY